jgi:hypothetical protein
LPGGQQSNEHGRTQTPFPHPVDVHHRIAGEYAQQSRIAQQPLLLLIHRHTRRRGRRKQLLGIGPGREVLILVEVEALVPSWTARTSSASPAAVACAAWRALRRSRTWPFFAPTRALRSSRVAAVAAFRAASSARSIAANVPSNVSATVRDPLVLT